MKNGTVHHPFTLSLCGYSGSGKTTLMSKLIERLNDRFEIGFYKSDAHRFQMDKEGKDTCVAWESGASQVFIADPHHCALLERSKTSGKRRNLPQALLRSDILLIEGRKQSDYSKIVMLDEGETILEKVEDGSLEHAIAYVGRKLTHEKLSPYFFRDDVDGIAAFVQSYFEVLSSRVPVFGLVLAGGRSRRMKSDKSQLDYHGTPQYEHCARLLGKHCSQVFVSARDEQVLELPPGVERIDDRFFDFGPIGGILSAMSAHPQAAWLVVACDLPLLSNATLSNLLRKRNPFKSATYFLAHESDLPEPMCAIYEPKMRQFLFDALGRGVLCPRKVLDSDRRRSPYASSRGRSSKR